MESIFESLENLPISEECFNDIMNIVEEIINESPTVGAVKSAVGTSFPLRMNKYKEVKANPNSTSQDIKRASDRVDKAAKIKSGLFNDMKYYDNTNVNTAKKSLKREIGDRENEEGYSGTVDTSSPYKSYDSDTCKEVEVYDTKHPYANRSKSITKRQKMLTALSLLGKK